MSASARGLRCERLLSAAVLLVYVTLGAVCPAAQSAAPAVRVDDPWVRWLPAGVPAAGYLILVNTGDRPIALIAAESKDFGSVTIHHSLTRGGTVQMEEAKEIAVGPHSRLDFAANGYHLMLMNPLRPIESANQIPITLRFRNGDSLTILFEVRKPGAGP
jgi:periplasmic copper chaperone A